MFNKAISLGNQFIDFGCGFGRFLKYLIKSAKNFTYTGIDNSEWMVERAKELYPQHASNIHHQDITKPISIDPSSIVMLSAVLVHLSLPEQAKVIKNLSYCKPEALILDINQPSPTDLRRKGEFELIINPGIRMTWQDAEKFHNNLPGLFPNYTINHKEFNLSRLRTKHVFSIQRNN
jgi:SAM-dependent methyltransferase